jgi:hypothetical protein
MKRLIAACSLAILLGSATGCQFARNLLWHTALENDDARYEREHTGSYQDPLQSDLQDRFDGQSSVW